MCRLFGFKGSLATKLSFFLVDASNSLVKQAILDERNLTNSHGWGIGFYQNDQAYIQKRASSASFDFNFKFLTDFISTDTMIAHVRDATVGDISDHNCHPFLYKNWIWAHNGTVQNFELLRPIILQKIGPELAFEIMGTTDSEYSFYLFISKLRQKVDDIHSADIPLQKIKEALIETLHEINTLGSNVGITEPHKLNIIVTNGNMMAASRYGNTLYYATKTPTKNEDVRLYKDQTNLKIRLDYCDDSICNLKNDSVMIASEPINSEDYWREVPEQCIITIDNFLRVSLSCI